jgi:hypothetical protein
MELEHCYKTTNMRFLIIKISILLCLLIGCISDNGIEQTIEENYSEEQFQIACNTISISIIGDGTVGISPYKKYYMNGEDIAITASPYDGYVFDHWEGNVNSKSNPITLKMDTSKSLRVIFKNQTN